MWLVERGSDYTAIVSNQGGSILQWQYKDHMILGPTRVVEANGSLKRRGETHWCYPNFGTPPDHKRHVGKHGWLRDREMGVKFRQTDDKNSALYETLSQHGAMIRAGATILESRLTMTLGVEVDVGHESDLPVLPALHPYFAVPHRGLYVYVGGAVVASTNTGCGFSVPGGSLVLKREGREVSVELRDVGMVHLDFLNRNACTHIVIWSDNPSQYVCVEPIFGTPGTFADEKGQWLKPGTDDSWGVGFLFEPA